MKRKELIKHLKKHGCELTREGGKYSIFVNTKTEMEAPVTRHKEIADYTARKICKELGVDTP
ncbi:MAG TPA: type II toxin-antitoxin system HicA family toxin [Elusimicrobiales bacterium]|nr:type II toxin-antitoxin system HicA family toxin [Elusimicrobiales bacterium]